MQENLVIVESPAKAKTIEKFLGKDYKVMSSYGHIRDLKKKELSIDLDTLNPDYEIPDEKKKVVSELKKSAKAADKVWLASDEDREGEAISWHLCEVLGLDEDKTNRIVSMRYQASYIESYRVTTSFGYESCERTAGSSCTRPLGWLPSFTGVVAQSKACFECRTCAERSR